MTTSLTPCLSNSINGFRCVDHYLSLLKVSSGQTAVWGTFLWVRLDPEERGDSPSLSTIPSVPGDSREDGRHGSLRSNINPIPFFKSPPTSVIQLVSIFISVVTFSKVSKWLVIGAPLYLQSGPVHRRTRFLPSVVIPEVTRTSFYSKMTPFWNSDSLKVRPHVSNLFLWFTILQVWIPRLTGCTLGVEDFLKVGRHRSSLIRESVRGTLVRTSMVPLRWVLVVFGKGWGRGDSIRVSWMNKEGMLPDEKRFSYKYRSCGYSFFN